MSDPVLPRQGATVSYFLTKQRLRQYDEITVEEKTEVHVDNAQAQEVLMWKNFSSWARKVRPGAAPTEGHEFGLAWSGEGAEVRAANAMSAYSIHTRKVLDALMESIQLDGAKVDV